MKWKNLPKSKNIESYDQKKDECGVDDVLTQCYGIVESNTVKKKDKSK